MFLRPGHLEARLLFSRRRAPRQMALLGGTWRRGVARPTRSEYPETRRPERLAALGRVDHVQASPHRSDIEGVAVDYLRQTRQRRRTLARWTAISYFLPAFPLAERHRATEA